MLHKVMAALTVFVVVLPAAAQAQQWTAEQQEVWAFEQRCWQVLEDKNFEESNSCFHEEYVGWFATDPAPMPFNEAVHRRFVEKDRQVAHNMTPHSIKIHGNIAVVHLSGFVMEPGPDGRDRTSWYHWTDIALKENGTWSWIADHGHPGPVY